MVMRCCVRGCSNRQQRKHEENKINTVSFHRFPRDQALKNVWLQLIPGITFYSRANTVVCSAHFKPEDINCTYASGVRQLREGAIPSIFNFPPLRNGGHRNIYPRSNAVICTAYFRPEDLSGASAGESQLWEGAVPAVVHDENRDFKTGKTLKIILNGKKSVVTELPGGSYCELYLTIDVQKPDDDFTFLVNGVEGADEPSSKLRKTLDEDVDTASSDPSGTPSKETDTVSNLKDFGGDSSPNLKSVAVENEEKSVQTVMTQELEYSALMQYQSEIEHLKEELLKLSNENGELRSILASLENMSGLTGKDLKALEDMLKEGDTSSDEDDLPNPGLTRLGPGDIQVPSKTTSRVKGNKEGFRVNGKDRNERIPTHPDDIWDINEVDAVAQTDDVITDPRDRPEYEIIYKQKVGSEDIFLQMGQKTPMTSSCEIMVVTVTMKGETTDNIDCNITDVDLNIRSPLYRLHLPFPHSINPDTATAEWDSTTSRLVVTLQLVRELDFVNF